MLRFDTCVRISRIWHQQCEMQLKFIKKNKALYTIIKTEIKYDKICLNPMESLISQALRSLSLAIKLNRSLYLLVFAYIMEILV